MCFIIQKSNEAFIDLKVLNKIFVSYTQQYIKRIVHQNHVVFIPGRTICSALNNVCWIKHSVIHQMVKEKEHMIITIYAKKYIN